MEAAGRKTPAAWDRWSRMNIFIDTNVFLAFFHFSSDDLEELKKLAVLVRRGDVHLLLPQQVVIEFRRNRDGKIADALKRSRDYKLNLQFPQLFKGYPQYEELRQHLRDAEASLSALLESLDADIEARRLKADTIIEQLLSLTPPLPSDDALLSRAEARLQRGDPPGKRGSAGDAINWECLLDAVPEAQDLYFISDDGDWMSPLDGERFNRYLQDEWCAAKHSGLHFYRRLSPFFRRHFPGISLATEEEKEGLILSLAASRRFRDSRSALHALAGFEDLNDAQLNAIVRAAITNNQIYWIINDTDISAYLRGLIRGREDRIDADSLKRLMEMLPSEEGR